MNINGGLSVFTVPSGSTATEIIVYNTTGGIVERRSTLPQASIDNLTTDLSNKQPLDATLTALAAYNTNGILTQTSADTFTGRTLTAPAAGFTITNPAGIAGNPTFVLSNDLAALEGLGSTGIAVRSATDTWVQRSLTAPAAGITITNPAGIAGNMIFALADDLGALEALAGTGFAVRTGTSTWANRTIVGTAGQIVVTVGNGVSGDPILALDSTFVSNNSLWRPGSTGTNSIRTQSTYNDATGNNSICTGGVSGAPNLVSGAISGIIGGQNITVSGDRSFATGSNHVVAASYSFATGDSHSPTTSALASFSFGTNTIATTYGELAYGVGGVGGFNAQNGIITLEQVTTNATPTGMLDGAGNFGIVIDTNSAWNIEYTIQATIQSATNKGSTRTWYGRHQWKDIAGTKSSANILAPTGNTGDTGTTTFGAPTFATVVGTRFYVTVTGAASTTVAWLCRINYQKLKF